MQILTSLPKIVATVLFFCVCTVGPVQNFVNAEEEFEPRTEVLETKDGVQLKATYYPSDVGKEAVPVILIHDFQGNRNVFDSLAAKLQKGGSFKDPSSGKVEELPQHAVITVDLRGHGGSTRQTMFGNSRELGASKLRKADFAKMIFLDMESVRKFLVKENDEGNLNLNKLCLVGFGAMGSNVALNWSAKDWTAPILPSRKQGQDVHGLILVSPRISFKGLTILDSLKIRQMRKSLSVLIVYGKEHSKTRRDSERIHKIFSTDHPKTPQSEWREKQDLFLQGYPTALQGTELLTAPKMNIDMLIQQFIDLRLVKKEFEWSKRLDR